MTGARIRCRLVLRKRKGRALALPLSFSCDASHFSAALAAAIVAIYSTGR